jgi:hypothetical protein
LEIGQNFKIKIKIFAIIKMSPHNVGSKIVHSIGTVSSNSNTVSILPGGTIDCTKYAGYIILVHVNSGTESDADFYLQNYKAGTVLNIVLSNVDAAATPVNTLHAPSTGTIDGKSSVTISTVTHGFQIFIFDSATAYRTGMSM